jgi:hypothetical protein
VSLSAAPHSPGGLTYFKRASTTFLGTAASSPGSGAIAPREHRR